MDERRDVTVPMPRAWEECIEEQLSYGDSKSGWIREAIRLRFEAEGIDYPPLEGEDESGNPQTGVVAD